MDTDLPAEQAPEQVVDPTTGELISLREADVDHLAVLLVNLRDLEGQLRRLKQVTSVELHRRMDEQRQWTLEGQRWRVTSSSPQPTESYDPDRLEPVLRAWVREAPDESIRRLRSSAYYRAIETVVTRKAKAGSVRAILKGADPALRAAIEECRFTEEKSRYPKVVSR